MKTKPETVILLVSLACICLAAVILVLLRTTRNGNESTSASTVDPFAQARTQGLRQIEQRTEWPPSPKAVCEAFWDARARKDYVEMQILWPGTASWDWSETCKNDANAVYVFGEPSLDGMRVPYAEKTYFENHGTYNLAMHLQALETKKGTRYYVVSGN